MFAADADSQCVEPWTARTKLLASSLASRQQPIYAQRGTVYVALGVGIGPRMCEIQFVWPS